MNHTPTAHQPAMLVPATQHLPAELADAATAAVSLVTAAKAENTRRAYESALSNYDAWRDLRNLPIADETLALYLGALATAGRSAALASMTVNAAKHRGDTIGQLTADALAGFKREDAARPKRQARALTLEDVGAMTAVACQPRPRGRGMESEDVAKRRGIVEQAMLGCLFYGGLRRSEVAALRVRDVEPQDDGTCLVHVRVSKTNQEGGTEDVRLVKNGCSAALRELCGSLDADASVFALDAASINRRIQTLAKQAGIEGKVSAHSGRRGLATELVKRGADTASVQLAGGWKSASMVTRYASGVRATQGAVAKYL